MERDLPQVTVRQGRAQTRAPGACWPSSRPSCLPAEEGLRWLWALIWERPGAAGRGETCGEPQVREMPASQERPGRGDQWALERDQRTQQTDQGWKRLPLTPPRKRPAFFRDKRRAVVAKHPPAGWMWPADS